METISISFDFNLENETEKLIFNELKQMGRSERRFYVMSLLKKAYNIDNDKFLNIMENLSIAIKNNSEKNSSFYEEKNVKIETKDNKISLIDVDDVKISNDNLIKKDKSSDAEKILKNIFDSARI